MRRSRTKMVMDTIKWVNDTFVPRGLKPIEDLPKGVPGQGEACILANILRSNPRWNNATVSSALVHLNLNGDYEYGDPITDIEMPEEVREFILDFDSGRFPELTKPQEFESI